MNRRGFFQRVVGVVSTAVVAPSLISGQTFEHKEYALSVRSTKPGGWMTVLAAEDVRVGDIVNVNGRMIRESLASSDINPIMPIGVVMRDARAGEYAFLRVY